MSTATAPGAAATGAPRAPAPRRRPGHGSLTRRPTTGWLFVLPAALIVVVLFLLPLGVLLVMSFTDWPLLGAPEPAGLENYASIPDDDLFVGAIGFTLLYTALATALIFGISFVLAAVSASPRRGAAFYRTAFFLPYVVGTAAAALIWYAAVNPRTGVMERLARAVGLTDGSFGFLATPDKALWTTLSLVVWKFIGFQVVVLVVGLQSVPGELYEAARMDGASSLQRLRWITLPFLRPTLALLLVLSVTGSLLAFDQFYVLTGGGPDRSTVTLVFAIYQTAFTSFDLGRAAALSVVLLLALVAVNGLQLLALRHRED